MVLKRCFRSFTYKMFIAAILVFANLTFSFQTAAPSSAAVARVLETFHKAMRDSDVVQLERLLCDQFVWTNEDGIVRNKADFLKLVGDAKSSYGELTTDQESSSEFRDAAVVTGQTARRQTGSSKPIELRYTLTLIKVGRDWKLGAYHTSRLTPD